MKINLSQPNALVLLQDNYPNINDDLTLVESNNGVFVYEFSNEDVHFVQEIFIINNSEGVQHLYIGVNAKSNFLKERFYGFYKETLVQVYNRFLLLQLGKTVIQIESEDFL